VGMRSEGHGLRSLSFLGPSAPWLSARNPSCCTRQPWSWETWAQTCVHTSVAASSNSPPFSIVGAMLDAERAEDV